MKDFIIVCNKNALFWKETFPLYMEDKMRFGYNNIGHFIIPNDSPKWERIENGNKINNYEGTGRWLVTFPVHKEERDIDLIPYNEKDFPPFDNNKDIVNTDSIYNIPDTDKYIGVPIGIIDYPIKGYEVIGKMVDKGEYDFGKPIVDGKMKYVRIVIKKK